MVGTANVYLIWYGGWSTDALQPDSEQVILRDFVSHLGGSPYFSTVRLYPNIVGNRPDGNVAFGGTVVDPYSHGTILTDGDVEEIVLAQIGPLGFPPDAGGIFVVLGSPDVWASSGLDETYCAFHGHIMTQSARFRYAFVGAPGRAPSRCAAQSVGPNGTLGADASASLVAAAPFDAVTDPDLDAWYDHLGLEGADKCVWTFGTTYRAPNGALANVRLGARDYLLQQLWVPSRKGGACALHP